MKYRYILFIGLLGMLFACQPELDDFSPSKGNADFSTYVALGNSLTAGYADGSLYKSAQLNSYPSILAEQFKKIGGGEFVQPMMEGEYGILPGKLKLGDKTDCLGETSLGPIPDVGQLDDLAPLGYTVNNMGVPGAKSFHLLAPGYGDFAAIGVTANPYYARFASSAVSTVVGDAIDLQPTFFTLWIGNNDILGYASSGGASDTITGENTFAYMMNTILMSITATGAKGAVAGIPDMLKSPYFTFMPTQVPYNGLVLTRQGQVDSLNFAYAQLGITFNLGQNPFIVEDAITHFPRQMKNKDIFLLTLPTDSLKCFGMGSAVPIPHKYILDNDETIKVNSSVIAYNNIIEGLAAQYNLAYVDIYMLMSELEQGVITDGVTLSTEFVTGNAFSLDGVHLTQMGYAYIANQFIQEINKNFNANLPVVSVTGYSSVILP
jgi:lysophospholipase L1-like esterase